MGYKFKRSVFNTRQKSFRLDNRGSAIVYSIIVASLVAGIGYYLGDSADIELKRSSQQSDDQRVLALAQRAVAVGGFLVSNNIVYCKEDPWSFKRDNKSNQCLWASEVAENAKFIMNGEEEGNSLEQADGDIGGATGFVGGGAGDAGDGLLGDAPDDGTWQSEPDEPESNFDRLLADYSLTDYVDTVAQFNEDPPDPSQFFLDQIEGEGEFEGFLTFKAFFEAGWDDETKQELGLNDLETEVILGMRLTNWADKESGEFDQDMMKVVGSIPNANVLADNDKHLVMLKVLVRYRERNSKGEVGPALNYRLVSGIRRPLGVPLLLFNPVICTGGCQPALSASDVPGCASGQQDTAASIGNVTGLIINLGPGPIYKLSYNREFIWNRREFPNMPAVPVEKKVMFDTGFVPSGEEGESVFAGLDADVMESGAVLFFNDRVTCPTKYVRQATRDIQMNGKTEVQHGATAGWLKYSLTVAPFDFTRMSEGDLMGYLGLTRDEFGHLKDTGNGEFDYTNPDHHAEFVNHSEIEPSKMSGKLKSARVETPSSITKIYHYVPPH